MKPLMTLMCSTYDFTIVLSYMAYIYIYIYIYIYVCVCIYYKAILIIMLSSCM